MAGRPGVKDAGTGKSRLGFDQRDEDVIVEQGLPLADKLAVVFARMSGFLLSRETVDTAVDLVASLAAEIIVDSAGAGVSLMGEAAHRTTRAASDPVME